MQFLSDVYLRCAECNGRRYRGEVLEVKLALGQGRVPKSIADVLEMTVAEALDYFAGHDAVRARLQPLVDVGLEYLTLGQAVPTLSGGEAQRLKLAAELVDARHQGAPRCSCSTSRRRACTSPTWRSSSRRSIASSRPGTRSSSSSTTSTSSRPPIGSSTSAPKAATPAARSSPTGPPAAVRAAGIGHTAARASTVRDRRVRYGRCASAREAAVDPGRVGDRRRPRAYRDVFTAVPSDPSRDGSPATARRRRANAIEIVHAREHNLKNVEPRDPARQAHGHHGRQRQRQEHDRVRHPVRRRPAPLPRVVERLRAPVRRARRPRRRRRRVRHSADRRDRAAHEPRRPQEHRRDADRDLSFPAPLVRQARRAALPRLRRPDRRAEPRSDPCEGHEALPRQARGTARTARHRPQGLLHRARRLGRRPAATARCASTAC